jgi:hypothetical protein
MSLIGPNLGMNYDYALGEFWKTGGDANWKLIDMLFQLGILDKDLIAQPGSPAEGDRYIIPVGATGADWAGQDGNIAVFINAVWEFHIPKAGWQAFAIDEGFVYYHNGTAWFLLQTPSSTSEPISDTALTGATPLDISAGRNFRCNGATGNVTLSFVNIPPGLRTEIAYTWKTDGIGGQVLTYPAGTIWANGIAPAASIGANERDNFLFVIDDVGVIEGNLVGALYA